MLTVISFMLFNVISYILALTRGPAWGLFAYVNIYINAPVGYINWWANMLPFHRWSLLTSVILVISLLIHNKKLSSHKFVCFKWVFLFFILSSIITFTTAVDFENSISSLYQLFTYFCIVFIIIKSLKNEDQFRQFFTAIIALTGYLCLNIYSHGKRIHSRLEGMGPADSANSNELALFLVAIIPVLFVFIKNGRSYERMIALCSFPFILNAFILCNSRGATVALLGGIFAAGIMIADKQIRKNLVLILLAMVPVFIFLTDAAFIDRFSSLLGLGDAIQEEDATAQLSSGRTVIWGYGFDMVKDYPFGAGPNGFKRLARFYMPNEILTFSKNSLGQRAAHNTYLQALVEQGYFGLFLWFCLLLSTCITLKKSFNMATRLSPPKPFLKNSIFALNVGFYSIIFGGIFTSRIYYEYFWWQLALTSVIYGLVKQVTEKEEKKILLSAQETIKPK